MASYNLPIFTKAGNQFIKNVIAGKDKIKFTKIIYSSDDYDAKSDDDLANVNDLTNKELVVTPETFLDSVGNINVRAYANNSDLKNDLSVKSYGLYVSGDNTDKEMLLAIATSQTADFLPAATTYVANLVSYTFTIGVSNTQNITFSDNHYISVNRDDLDQFKNFISQNYVSDTDFQNKINDLKLRINQANNSVKDIDFSGAIASAYNQAKSYSDNNFIKNTDYQNDKQKIINQINNKSNIYFYNNDSDAQNAGKNLPAGSLLIVRS